VKRIFLDTNILLDVLLEREPFWPRAQQVWSLVEHRKIKAAVSTLSVSNVFFIVKRLANREKAYWAIELLSELFQLVAVTPTMIRTALQARFPDFEDAIQYYCAHAFRAKAIISRDDTGFAKSTIPVLDCAQYVALLDE